MTLDEERDLQKRARKKRLDEEVARRDPGAAQALAGFRQRTQQAEARGVLDTERRELLSHMKNNGRFTAQSDGKGYTTLFWEGRTKSGAKTLQPLQVARGNVTAADFQKSFLGGGGGLDIVRNNWVDNFGRGFSFVMGRTSAFKPTEAESQARKTQRQLTRELVLSEWKPAGGWTSEEGGSAKSQDMFGMRPKQPAQNGGPVSTQWDGFQKDETWKTAGREMTRGEKLLYNIGVRKEDWDKADHAERKKILEEKVYGGGYGAQLQEASKHIADYYDERYGSKLDDWSSAYDKVKALEGKRKAQFDNLLGKGYYDSLNPVQRKMLDRALARSKQEIGQGDTLNSSIRKAKDAEDVADRRLDEEFSKYYMWKDASRGNYATLYRRRQKALGYA